MTQDTLNSLFGISFVVTYRMEASGVRCSQTTLNSLFGISFVVTLAITGVRIIGRSRLSIPFLGFLLL